ncbi:Ldh family oxidoreductase [Pandoraea fibrosis]|uniref:Ldh family oxidoreductase n=1 Tax=Pandoraea fibrosis TaxID=1891094 RepID=A0ABX6HTL8_9BURK|nr:Ldh family oxidoreductase [Pandoraea fibrosis]QHE92537.1 Ldh family oxidoreductase [Pandoraea fibrosis]QHF13907.1 Ldh family oxidoreductase [Pandoraea fibrosis]
MRLRIDEARALARRAALAAGANEQTATSLANATVAAERAGHRSVGFAHLPDYLEGLSSGRIAGTARPEIRFPAPTTIRVDADAGIAQLGFDLTFDKLVENARQFGVALFLQGNSFTVGELGYYTRRLAEAGLVCLATSNGPAMVTTPQSRQPVFGTNPMSFAAPVAGGVPLVIDQASSATAFVNIRDAATRGETIPETWALDTAGEPTTDSRSALSGMLLAFGGARGANIALMVEILSAGMTGANWSLDTPSFQHGAQSPGVGLFIVAIDPAILAPDLPDRLTSQIERLSAKGIYIAGRGETPDHVCLPPSLLSVIEHYCRFDNPTPSPISTNR